MFCDGELHYLGYFPGFRYQTGISVLFDGSVALTTWEDMAYNSRMATSSDVYIRHNERIERSILLTPATVVQQKARAVKGLSVGPAVTKMRQNAGLTIPKAAASLSIRSDELVAIEKGESELVLSELTRVCKQLGYKPQLSFVPL
jgi:hypothetical protein